MGFLTLTEKSSQVTKLCQEAIEHGFKTVCVNVSRLELAAALLKGENVKTVPIAVVG